MSSGSPINDVQRNGPRPSENIGRIYLWTKPGKEKASLNPPSNACCRRLFPYSNATAPDCDIFTIALTCSTMLSLARHMYNFGSDLRSSSASSFEKPAG